VKIIHVISRPRVTSLFIFCEWSHWTLQPSQVCLSYMFSHNIEMKPTFLPSKKANVVLSIYTVCHWWNINFLGISLEIGLQNFRISTKKTKNGSRRRFCTELRSKLDLIGDSAHSMSFIRMIRGHRYLNFLFFIELQKSEVILWISRSKKARQTLPYRLSYPTVRSFLLRYPSRCPRLTKYSTQSEGDPKPLGS